MSDWVTSIAGILGVLVAALAVMGRVERSKRVRAEKRADVFEHQASLALETARVLHDVAMERDDELLALEQDAETKRARVDDSSEELKKAAGSRDRVAGLWNKTFGKEEPSG